ncbi:MAG TPA: PP2C family protein-serine/threonine phosphatase [Phycisphaerae bacterium]|nr:PP2C family protein-serine/threonine phosphatase [Phycisphaerae bacterium]
MSTIETASAPERELAKSPPEFSCAEIWGGNRPIDTAIELPGVHGRVYSQPCRGGRGGDIHYVSLCNSGLLSRMCLADVAGHGETVALVSEEIHRLLRRFMDNLDERRVLAELNRRLTRGTETAMTTAVAVSYIPPLHLVYISSAGHPPAWLYRRAEARWERLAPCPGEREERALVDLPLAVDAETRFSRRRVRVRPGDRLLLMTDGMLEAPAPGGELFGEERLAAVLDQQHAAQAGELAHAIMAAVHAHVGRPQLVHDDVTLLVAEFTPGPRALGIWEVLKNRVLRPLGWGRGEPAQTAGGLT